MCIFVSFCCHVSGFHISSNIISLKFTYKSLPHPFLPPPPLLTPPRQGNITVIDININKIKSVSATTTKLVVTTSEGRVIDCYCSEESLTSLKLYLAAFQRIPSQGFFRRSREVKKVSFFFSFHFHFFFIYFQQNERFKSLKKTVHA